jgi:ribosomal protein S18 acetylase RimI-like enzyme
MDNTSNNQKRELIYCDAVPEDALGIATAQQKTWISTYTNEELSITKEAVMERVAGYTSPERVARYQESIRSNKNIHTWVVKDGSTIVGFCTAEKLEDKGEVKALYILPEYQGVGAGSILMQKALDWLQQKRVELEVADYNDKAMGFYKKFGFKEYAKGPKEIEFSSGGTLKTLLMERIAE